MGQKCTKATLQEERARWVAKRRYAEPDAGRHLASWAAEAGFEAGDCELNFSVRSYSASSDEEDRRRWGRDQ